jgi:polysaccharide biosynthesis protein PslH
MHNLRLLLISHVAPFPGHAGQQQRVKYTLRALRDTFDVTALTFATPREFSGIERLWMQHVDDVVVMESRTQRHPFARLYHKLAGIASAKRSGLKDSNYVLGEVEFSARRIAAAIDPRSFDIVLFEYWHAHRSAALFRALGIPTVLDMHDVLWQSLKRQLEAKGITDAATRVAVYREQEERAWRDFDALIAINEGEKQYVHEVYPEARVLLAQMGTDIAAWPYTFETSTPQRIGFWGSLGSEVNGASAIHVAEEVMPLIWRQRPDTEYWIVGANPPKEILALQQDARVRVTGFVDKAAPLLGSMTAVLCPWEGTYGFRSRLVEVLACGVPVIASPDAVFGMGMADGEGLHISDSDADMAEYALSLLGDAALAMDQSRRARAQAVSRYSFEATYGALAGELRGLLRVVPD